MSAGAFGASAVDNITECRHAYFSLPAQSAITPLGYKMPESSRTLNSNSHLQSALARQDERFSSAFAILEQAIAERAFPAASIAVAQTGEVIALKSSGAFVYETDPAGAALLASLAGNRNFDSLSGATIFDLASLTKPVATTTMSAILYERGLLELDAPIIGTVPEFRLASDPRRNQVTFRMLLAHSSGLPAYEKLFLTVRSRDELLQSALKLPLTAAPGTRAEYSDIGFILLGVALERLAEEPLNVFCQREIFGPLGMSNTTFNPPTETRARIPPTADERRQAESTRVSAPVHASHKPCSTFRNRVIQGEVQDENAWVLGGVAGHAGLFSTAVDLAKFAHAMLQGRNSVLRPETVALFTRREPTPVGTSRSLGWDTPSHPSQSGKYFGPKSYGHLGYTGTSLWIDPDRQLSITLLTNRTWPDCSSQAIKQVRPKFHDAIIEALDG
jgi:serine-type D-Ala-D-Ala carboxypeptidase